MQGPNSVLDYLSDDMKREYLQYIHCHQEEGQLSNCAMRLYIHHLKRKQHLEELRSGYVKMATINRGFAESGFVKDMTSLDDYELILRMRDAYGSETR